MLNKCNKALKNEVSSNSLQISKRILKKMKKKNVHWSGLKKIVLCLSIFYLLKLFKAVIAIIAKDAL